MDQFQCRDCGHKQAAKFTACPTCNSDMVRELKPKRSFDTHAKRLDGGVVKARSITDESVDIRKIRCTEEPRHALDMKEVARVFGGEGVVHGSVILIAGPPGVGKSTLFLQIAASICTATPLKDNECAVIYATGEEGKNAIGSRAHRLDRVVPGLRVIVTKEIAKVEAAIKAQKPKMCVLDSVPTFSTNQDGEGEGSTKQIKAIIRRLHALCESIGCTLLLIAHVTKENVLGGPRALEHFVDTFAMFDGDRRTPIRVLTAIKNRNGAAGESAVLEMTKHGLKEVPDAAAQLLAERAVGEPGSVVFAAAESDRPTLLEIEAAVSASDEFKVSDKSGGESGTATPAERPPKLASVSGVVASRVPRLLSMLMSADVSLANTATDIEANAPPGLDFTEPSMDLAVAVAVASSAMRLALPKECVVFGIVSVTGRVKAVTRCTERLETAMSSGFTLAVLPGENIRRGEVPKGMSAVGVEHLRDIVGWLKKCGTEAHATGHGVTHRKTAIQTDPAPAELPS